MRYVLVLRGRLSDTLRDVLHPAAVAARNDSTEVTLEIEDDAQLYGALARLERLGISIVSFQQAGGEAQHGV